MVGGVEAGEAGTARMPPIFAGELPTQRGAGCKRLKMIPPGKRTTFTWEAT